MGARSQFPSPNAEQGQGPGWLLFAQTQPGGPRTLLWACCLLLHSFPNPQAPRLPGPVKEDLAFTGERIPRINNVRGLKQLQEPLNGD